jgi:hypothetical protein
LFISKECQELVSIFHDPEETRKHLGFNLRRIGNYSFFFNENNERVDYGSDIECHMEAVKLVFDEKSLKMKPGAQSMKYPKFKVMNLFFDELRIETKSFVDMQSCKLIEQYAKYKSSFHMDNNLYVAYIPFAEMRKDEKAMFRNFGINLRKEIISDDIVGNVYAASFPDALFNDFINLCASLFNTKGTIPIAIRGNDTKEIEAELQFMKIMKPSFPMKQLTLTPKNDGMIPIKEVCRMLKGSDIKLFSITINPQKENELFVFCDSMTTVSKVKPKLALNFSFKVSDYKPN